MKYLIGLVFLISSISAFATFEIYDGAQSMGGINSQSDSIFVGPSAVLEIPAGQQWNIFSEYVYIHPNAQITGDGELLLRDPIQVGLPASTLKIDGGGSLLDVNVIFENESNMELAQIVAPTALGWSAAEGAGQDNLYIGRDFLFNSEVEGRTPAVAITNNHVILGTNHVIFDNDATVSGYHEDAYFVTASTGTVNKEGLNGSFTFPVGFTETIGGTDYTPAQVTDAGGATFSVSVADYAAGTSACTIQQPEEGVDRMWQIETTSGTATGATLDLQHNTATNGSLYDASTSQFVTRCVGTAPNNDGGAQSLTEWDFVGASNCSTESGTGTLTTEANVPGGTELSRSGLTDFTTYTHYTKSVCDFTPLPVKLGDVFTSQDCNEVTIYWETLSELNNSHFEIERSANGVDFIVVGEVDGAGNSSSTLNYSFEDIVTAGTWFYRIRQVDFDGSSETSPILEVVVDCEKTKTIVFPNPAQEQTTIQFQAKDNHVRVLLFTTKGQLIMVEEIDAPFGGQINFPIDLSNLAPGLYLIRIENGKHIETKKLLIQ